MRHVLAASLLLVATTALAGDPPPKRFGRDRLVDIRHLRLELRVDVPEERVEGAAELTVQGITDGTRRLELDAVRLDVRRVTVDGAPAEHDDDGRVLGIALDPPLDAGQTRVVRVEYSASPRNGLYFVHGPGSHRELDQCWSQGETEENRHWFPVHDDPSERLTSETLVTVDAPLSVVANGPLVEVVDAGDGRRTFHHRMDFPHVPYLVSIAVGDWASRREEWDGVALSYHAPRAREADMDRTFARTPRILAFLSRETGVKYPYPSYSQVAVSEYIWGGMENIAATTLTDQTLHDARAHRDWPSDSLVAHEAAHQWFGDYVTTKGWSDVWLNEGFATYYAALAMGDLEGPDQLVLEFDGLRHSAIDADSGDNRRPVVTNRWHDEADLFDGHAYAKGAMVLRALRRELGDEGFRRSVTAWLERFGGRSADTADFIAVIEDVTGRDVSRFFDQWIYSPGQPDLKASWTWKDGDCAVTIRQEQATDAGEGLFEAPLDLQVLLDGEAIDRAVRLTRREETFHVPCATKPRAVVVDPQGHLLRTLEVERGDEEATWVLRHATHLLARLEAARELKESSALREPLDGLGEIALSSGEPWSLRREAAAALESSGAAGTPVLLEILAKDADSRVRTAAARSLGRHRRPEVQAALLRALSSEDSYAVRAAAARALRRFPDSSVDRALEAATSQPSHREEVLGAALDTLAERRSPRLRAIAERLADDSKPYAVRLRAIAALGVVARDAAEEPERRQVRESIAEWLDDRLFRVRMAAADALVTAGHRDQLGELRRVASAHPHDLTRARMRQKVVALEKSAAQAATVAELRRALDDEREAREKLEDRLRAIERRLPAAKAEGAAE